MSALIAILTLARFALGFGRGAGLQQPLAAAIVFGLIAAVPLGPLFLPATIAMLERVGQAPSQERSGNDQ